MKNLLVVIIALMLTCAGAYASDLDPNFTKEYPNSKGTVTFNHQIHAETLGECAECHAQFEAFGSVVDKKYAHKVCKTCHKASLDTAPNSPVSCTGCHVR